MVPLPTSRPRTDYWLGEEKLQGWADRPESRANWANHAPGPHYAGSSQISERILAVSDVGIENAFNTNLILGINDEHP